MAKYHVDRDVKYMYQMWGTTSLITDYWTKPKQTNDPEDKTSDHQNQIHSHDDDYDDWEYGTNIMGEFKGRV